MTHLKGRATLNFIHLLTCGEGVQPEGLSYSCLCYPPGHCFQCQERHRLMAMILTQHFGKSNIDVDGPSNTLVLSSLDYYSSYMFLPLHHSHLLPQPFSITLSVPLPSISNNSFSGYHFLFSS